MTRLNMMFHIYLNWLFVLNSGFCFKGESIKQLHQEVNEKVPNNNPRARGWETPHACSALQQLLSAPTQGRARTASREYCLYRITEPIRLEKASKYIESNQ